MVKLEEFQNSFPNLQCGITLVSFSCPCLPNITSPLECVSTEHSLQNNLFFLIIPLCPVFLDSKSGENIQLEPGECYGPGIQERASPCSATRTLLLSCPHLRLLHRVDLQMPPGEVLDGPRRRRGSLLLYRPRSMPQHVFSLTLYCCLHPTLTAHRYVLVRPLWIQPPLLTCPPAAEHSLQKQGGALESDSEPMVSDMIQQQLTDLCFREIGSWADRISQKSMFHHDKQNVGSSSLKHYTFNNHMLHF